MWQATSCRQGELIASKKVKHLISRREANRYLCAHVYTPFARRADCMRVIWRERVHQQKLQQAPTITTIRKVGHFLLKMDALSLPFFWPPWWRRIMTGVETSWSPACMTTLGICTKTDNTIMALNQVWESWFFFKLWKIKLHGLLYFCRKLTVIKYGQCLKGMVNFRNVLGLW